MIALMSLWGTMRQWGLSEEVGESPYRVVWTSPSEDYHGSVPLGNGEVGLNAWVDPAGRLEFFIARTDAWDDYGRLVKVGNIRVVPGEFEPSDVSSSFRQILDVREGILHAEFGPEGDRVRVRLWVDADRDVAVVETESDRDLSPKAMIQLWRTDPMKNLEETEVSDLFWGDSTRERPIFSDILLSSDALKRAGNAPNRSNVPNAFNAEQIGWYHHNRKTPYFDEIGKTQGLDDAPLRRDPFAGRTFGAVVSATDPVRLNETTLASGSGKSHRFEIAVTSLPESSPEGWLAETLAVLENARQIPIDQRRDNHRRWWADFHDRSHVIFTPRVESEANESSPVAASSVADETFLVTQAGILQRYVDACGGRGEYPIKFNGSIFTVPEEGKSGWADYRRWGPGYWWQNTRFPYLSKPMAGDFEMMRPFLETYWRIFEVSRFRTQKYFGFEGAYFPECLYFWGDVFPETYGLEPWNEREDPLQASRWHRWEWVGGLEIAFMFLTYWEFTRDDEFLREKAIPLADGVTRFFDEFYSTDPATGKLVMTPSQALETFWDCRNPAPEIAGLIAVLDKLLALSDDQITSAERARFEALRKKIPDIPKRLGEDGRMILAPAEVFDNHNNRESPELYAVFPFRLFSFDKPDAPLARHTFEVRPEAGHSGWSQDDLFAAYLGLSESLRQNLTQRGAEKDKKSRFPVFWGPNFDWTPDQDHGGVLQTAIQAAVLQTDGTNIWVTPALPKEWDVDFKLHAPGKTVVEGRTVGGRIAALRVTPPERRADVTVVGEIPENGLNGPIEEEEKK